MDREQADLVFVGVVVVLFVVPGVWGPITSPGEYLPAIHALLTGLLVLKCWEVITRE